MKHIMQLINDIRNSPLAVRKRWLVLSTVASMLIVLGSWMLYTNITTRAADAGASRIGFAKIFSAGLAVVGDRFQNGVHKVAATLHISASFSNSFTVQVDPKSQNFVMEGLPAISKTTLP